MTAMFAMTKTKPTPSTRISPSTKKNEVSAPNQAPKIRPLPSARHICARIAVTGVLCVGLTRAKARGNDPLRPIPYHIRVPTFAVAMQTATVEDRNAAITSHQTPPQCAFAIARPGRTGELISRLTVSTPNPVITPQKVNTRKQPSRMIEIITDLGTLRRGSRVSSASGAAASQPVRPCTDRTTASAKPDSASLFPKLNTLSETPPGPGLANPVMASERTIIISAAPRTTTVRVDILIPRYCRNATVGAPTRMQAHHSQGTLMS